MNLLRNPSHLSEAKTPETKSNNHCYFLLLRLSSRCFFKRVEGEEIHNIGVSSSALKLRLTSLGKAISKAKKKKIDDTSPHSYLSSYLRTFVITWNRISQSRVHIGNIYEVLKLCLQLDSSIRDSDSMSLRLGASIYNF